VAQQAQNLAWKFQDRVLAPTHLLHDRDAKFCDASTMVHGRRSEGGPTALPNSESAYAERWVGTVRREALDHLLVFGPRQLERVLQEFIDHYHTARPHQGLGQRTPIRSGQVPSVPRNSEITRIDRRGGLLHEYARAA
jgi:hypothetical protein